MNIKDADKFDEILSRLFRTMGKSVPDSDVKRVWWDIMRPYDLEDFAKACAGYLREEDRFPVPAAVKRYIPRRTNAQRLLIYQKSPRGAGETKRAVDLLRECQKRLNDARG